MAQKIGHINILVKDFDEAIEFYTQKMGFELLSDKSWGHGQRWVALAPAGSHEPKISFSLADSEQMLARVGSQVGNHILFTIETDDCRRDYERMRDRGVNFLGEPQEMFYGTDVIFEDLYGNKFDLIQVSPGF